MSEGELKTVPETDKLKQQLEGKTAAINEFLRRIQELEGENKKLVAQRHRQDERIEALEKRARNQQKMEAFLTRREALAHQYMQLVSQAVLDAGVALEILAGSLTDDRKEALVSVINALGRLVLPRTSVHIVDFGVQLRKWSEDDAEFKKKLDDMGFGEFEQVSVDLSKPISYDE